MTDHSTRMLVPQYVRKFACIGGACEDTCCQGWRVPIDKETYKKYAWPGFLAAAFEAEGVAAGVVVVIALTAILAFMSIWAEPGSLGHAYSDAEGAFYAVLPHAAMAGLFGVVFAIALIAMGAGVASFWSDGGEAARLASANGG